MHQNGGEMAKKISKMDYIGKLVRSRWPLSEESAATVATILTTKYLDLIDVDQEETDRQADELYEMAEAGEPLKKISDKFHLDIQFEICQEAVRDKNPLEGWGFEYLEKTGFQVKNQLGDVVWASSLPGVAEGVKALIEKLS